jgi:hypothetical protein
MEKKVKTKKELKFEEFLKQIYTTVYGRFTFPQLVEKFGKPTAIMEYAKVEARTGLSSKATIVVERLVDIKMYFRDNLIIPKVPQSLLHMIDYDGIKVNYVRHPQYDGTKMIKATEKEIQGVMSEDFR